jgi:hypothetical protein
MSSLHEKFTCMSLPLQLVFPDYLVNEKVFVLLIRLEDFEGMVWAIE